MNTLENTIILEQGDIIAHTIALVHFCIGELIHQCNNALVY